MHVGCLLGECALGRSGHHTKFTFRTDLSYFLWFPAKAAVRPRPMNSTPLT